jgi:1,2-phenylacetyl-CoA epoxidase catalytic subunit
MGEYMSTEASEALRRFIIKVNTNAEIRDSFLKTPVKVLREAGVTLSEEAMAEVNILRDILVEKVPDIAELPSEYEELFEEINDSLSSGEIDPKKHEDSPMML